jgi:hypothetical protein
MTDSTRAWLEGLRAHAAAARLIARNDHDRPAAAVAAERAVLATHLVIWLDTELPGLLAERSAEARSQGLRSDAEMDAEPALVLTTTVAGLAAAADLLGRDDPLMRQWRERFACVTELEYRRFCMRHPDHDYLRHIAHWSWMKTRVPPQRSATFARWPLGDGEAYWLHRTGTAGAGEERRSTHLWKWNGTTAAMLKPFVHEGLPTM